MINISQKINYELSNVLFLITRTGRHAHLQKCCPQDKSLKVVPPPIETNFRPGEAAMWSPGPERICLQWVCGFNSVHFGQGHGVVSCPLSHEEFTVKWNVNTKKKFV
jgi:hypothetical protein